MLKSQSANETDNRIVSTINQCRVGTTHTADYIAPRRHYHCLSSADGHMSLQLLCIDQARLQCEESVRLIASDRNLWRGHLKQVCRRLYSRNVTYPLPICYEVNQAICRNMTPDEVMSFACMASHIDDIIQPELVKLSNAVFYTIGRERVPNQKAMTRVLSTYLYCMIAKEILDRCREVQRGSWYLLCINPLEASSRDVAYSICNRDLERMLTALQNIIKELSLGHTFQIPYTDDMANGVTIICNKMTDVINIWQACVEGGINAGHRTFDELEAELAKRKEARTLRDHATYDPNQQPSLAADTTPHQQPYLDADIPQPQQDLSTLFSSKGWTVKTS